MQRIKITVKTPKGQAEKCINTQKQQLIGNNAKLIEQKVTADNEFYWIIEPLDEGKYNKIIEKCAAGEVMIKKFYKVLFKMVDRANFLANKFSKGLEWIRRYLLNQIRKTYGEKHDYFKQIKDMPPEELKDFLNITDREAMNKLLSGKLIEIEKI